jgi:hypothetical protein
MTTAPLANTDVIVLDYLAALWAQSEDLAPELRDELMSTVADYIAVRRARNDDPADILRRLGPPDALAAAIRRGQMPPHVRLPALIGPPAPTPAGGQPAGGVEYTAVGLMTAGSFVLPLVSPVAGLLLATGSPHWTGAQKATAWTIAAGGGAGGLLLALMFAMSPFANGFAVVLIYLAMCAGSTVAGVTLLNALRRQGS